MEKKVQLKTAHAEWGCKTKHNGKRAAGGSATKSTTTTTEPQDGAIAKKRHCPPCFSLIAARGEKMGREREERRGEKEDENRPRHCLCFGLLNGVHRRKRTRGRTSRSFFSYVWCRVTRKADTHWHDKEQRHTGGERKRCDERAKSHPASPTATRPWAGCCNSLPLLFLSSDCGRYSWQYLLSLPLRALCQCTCSLHLFISLYIASADASADEGEGLFLSLSSCLFLVSVSSRLLSSPLILLPCQPEEQQHPRLRALMQLPAEARALQRETPRAWPAAWL